MRHPFHWLYLALAFFLATFPTQALKQGEAPENPAEDFVRASILFASPGETMLTSFGHASLRLECPDLKLDFVFSKENESDEFWSFVNGKLMAGTRAIKTQDFLKPYRKEQRAVYAYEINLPIRVKQRLWQHMDWHLEESDEIYSPIYNSCAVCVMNWLMEAVDTDSLEFAAWPENYNKSTRDLGGEYLTNRWLHFFCSVVVASRFVDDEEIPTRKVLHPAELVRVLQNCKAYGKPLLSTQRKVILDFPPKNIEEPDHSSLAYWVKQPEFPASIILLLALVGTFLDGLRRRKENKVRGPLVWVLISPALIAQLLFGIAVSYLMIVSDLPDTDWNWLIIPFNLLPLILWHWRKIWAIPYAILCIAWCLAMTLPKYGMVDPTSLILACAAAAAFLPLRKLKTEKKN